VVVEKWKMALDFILLSEVKFLKNKMYNMLPENDNQHEAGDRAEVNRLKNIPDNDTDPGEAQNVTDGAERISGEDAEKARNKAMEGINQERGR